MEFIKWMWGDITLSYKIALVLLVATTGVSVYGVTQHYVWVITLLTNLLVLWYIADVERCIYKAKKRIDKLGGKYER